MENLINDIHRLSNLNPKDRQADAHAMLETIKYNPNNAFGLINFRLIILPLNLNFVYIKNNRLITLLNKLFNPLNKTIVYIDRSVIDSITYEDYTLLERYKDILNLNINSIRIQNETELFNVPKDVNGLNLKKNKT